MSVVRGQARRRWCLVGGGVALTCAVPAIIAALPAAAPTMSAAQLRARILGSASTPYQGYAQSNAALGIPSLPGLSEVTALLDGATRTRVWQASASSWRVDVLSDAGERDTYGLPGETDIWDFGSNLLTKITGAPAVRLPRAADLIPPALAQRLLRDTGAASRITALAPKRVAGRNAAGLRVTPVDPATMIGQVDIWADPGTGLPLEVEVADRSGHAALVSEFLQVSFSRPGREILTPVLGPGSGITTTNAADITGALRNLITAQLPSSLAGRPRVKASPGYEEIGVYGSGLSTFGVLPLPLPMGLRAMDAARKAGGVPVTFPHGSGILISTPLLTVTIAQSSVSNVTFLLAGLVNTKLLTAAAAQLATQPCENLHCIFFGPHGPGKGQLLCRPFGPHFSCTFAPVPGHSPIPVPGFSSVPGQGRSGQ